MKQSLCTITSNVEISPGMYLMWIEAPDIASISHPGQFITVNCEGFTLRRPFSIHQVAAGESKESQIALLFKVVGKGTFWLSQQHSDDKIDILEPLGKGFTIASRAKNLLLVAGGIGIAPLVFLAQYASSQHSVSLIQGASTVRELYPFSSLRPRNKFGGSNLLSLPTGVQFIPVTEDGTMGRKGMATDILLDSLDWADQVFACGPIDMYKAMAITLNPSPSKGESLTLPSPSKGEGKGEGEKRSEESKLRKCQVSLEVRLGCGIGACYACTINTKKGLKQVCRDGPVFELDDILWQEVRI